MDDKGDFFTYSNRTYLRGTKRLVYRERLDRFKQQLGITPIEERLSVFHSRSCDVGRFTAYVKAKADANNEGLSLLYTAKKFRQYRLYSYINKQRTQAKMINTIKATYGPDHIVILGDWSMGKQMRHFISTPNLGLRRTLAQHFRVFLIDEYHTSKLHHRTEQECGKLSL
ncbi:hypothetical protein HDU91_003972, partial [Kappamyces sp. JEL0680]